MDKEKSQISIKIDTELLQKVDKQASEERRSRSAQIAYIIEKYYNLLEKK